MGVIQGAPAKKNRRSQTIQPVLGSKDAKTFEARLQTPRDAVPLPSSIAAGMSSYTDKALLPFALVLLLLLASAWTAECVGPRAGGGPAAAEELIMSEYQEEDFLKAMDYNDYLNPYEDDEDGATTANDKRVDNIDELLDRLDAGLDPASLDPLGKALLSGDLESSVFEDLLQRITNNIESALARVGTNLNQDTLRRTNATATNTTSATSNGGATATTTTGGSSAGNTTSSSISSSGGVLGGGDVGSGSDGGWVRASVERAATQALRDVEALDDQTAPQLIAEVILGVLSAAGKAGNGTGAGPSRNTAASSAQPSNSTGGGQQPSNGTGDSWLGWDGGGADDDGGNGTDRQGGRRLQQIGGSTGRIASAFRLVFGSFLDLLNGGASTMSNGG